jgi:hypothetical protein
VKQLLVFREGNQQRLHLLIPKEANDRRMSFQFLKIPLPEAIESPLVIVNPGISDIDSYGVAPHFIQ